MFVICWLLHPNPNWRAKLQDLEENAWVNQPVDLESYNFDALFSKFNTNNNSNNNNNISKVII